MASVTRIEGQQLVVTVARRHFDFVSRVNRFLAQLFGAAEVHTDCRIENAVAVSFHQSLCVKLVLRPLVRTAHVDAWLQLERDIVRLLANGVKPESVV